MGPSNIGKVLRNRKYIGEIEANGAVFKGNHDPIVSRASWDAVQASTQATSVPRAKASAVRPSCIYSSKGICAAACAAARWCPGQRQEERAYYQCLTRKDGGLTACTMRNVPRALLDESAWAYFAEVGIDAEATAEREAEAIGQKQRLLPLYSRPQRRP